jgi:cytosine/adenosine deaminase-related metal-dependent hydrolase
MAIGMEDVVGNFAVGKQFDAVIVDGSAGAGVYDTIVPEAAASSAEGVGDGGGGKRAKLAPSGSRIVSTLSSDFERYINLGDDRNVKRVYVRGRVVVGL